MTSHTQSQPEKETPNIEQLAQESEDKILCPHCLRTANNGLKCKGICVADDDY